MKNQGAAAPKSAAPRGGPRGVIQTTSVPPSGLVPTAAAFGLVEIRGLQLDPEAVKTNIVIFDVAGTGLSGEAFASRTLSSHGVRFSVLGPSMVRAVTHLDIPPDGIDRALEAARTAAVA